MTGDGKTSLRAGYSLTYDSPQMGTMHPGLFSTPTLGVFRVQFSQAPRFAPEAAGVTCLNPNNSTAGGDYVCLQPGVPIFGSSPTRRIVWRRPAADRHGLYRALGPSLHLRPGDDRQFRADRRRDSRQLQRRSDLQLGSRLSLP